MATSEALKDAAGEALVRWAASAVPVDVVPRAVAHAARARRVGARAGAERPTTQTASARWPTKSPSCRSSVERTIAVAAAEHDAPPPTPSSRDRPRGADGCSCRPTIAGAVREPAAWHAIIAAARARFTGAQARELLDALDGIEAATQLSAPRAARVSELTREADEGRPPAIVAVWPPDRSAAAWRSTGRWISTSWPSRTTCSCASAASSTGRRC